MMVLRSEFRPWDRRGAYGTWSSAPENWSMIEVGANWTVDYIVTLSDGVVHRRGEER